MTADRLGGLYAAVSTPIDKGGDPDHGRLAAHARWVVKHGVDAVCPFGTTGEGASFTVGQKLVATQGLAGAIGSDRIIVSATSAAIGDAIRLARHAAELHARAILLAPPFFYKRPSGRGVYEFYARVIDAVGAACPSVLLYNIPQVTAVPIEHDVVHKLRNSHSEIVRGIKDSGGDLAKTLSYIHEHPSLSVMSGTDSHIVTVMRAGGTGTLTGMANINPRALRAVVDRHADDGAVDLGQAAGKLHQIVESYGGVPAMKAVIAHCRSDTAWLATLPPVTSLDEDSARQLVAKLQENGHEFPAT